MKLSGTYTPPNFMGIEVKAYENATLEINEAWSNLDAAPPYAVVDFYQDGKLVLERIGVTTLEDDYSKDDVETQIFNAFIYSMNIDKMEIVD